MPESSKAQLSPKLTLSCPHLKFLIKINSEQLGVKSVMQI